MNVAECQANAVDAPRSAVTKVNEAASSMMAPDKSIFLSSDQRIGLKIGEEEDCRFPKLTGINKKRSICTRTVAGTLSWLT